VKIVGYLHSSPPMRTVGGETMTLRLLGHSADLGHDVSVIVRELEHDRMLGNIRLLAGHPASHDGIIRELNRADLIVTHPEIADGPSRYTSRVRSTPLLGIVHNLGKRTMNGLRQRPNMIVVANSYYTAERLYDLGVLGDRDPTIIQPPTEPLYAAQGDSNACMAQQAQCGSVLGGAIRGAGLAEQRQSRA